MNTKELVTAVALKAGVGNFRPLTWTEIGDFFNLTKDAVRNRVNRFKEKYNIVDADTQVAYWNRDFLYHNTPDSEQKIEFNAVEHCPGDVSIRNGTQHIHVDTEGTTLFIRGGKVERGFVPCSDKSSKNEYSKTHYNTFKNASVVVSDSGFVLSNSGLTVNKVDVLNVIEPLKFLVTPNVLIVVRDGQPLSIDKSHKNFERIQKSLEAGKWQEVLDFIDLKSALTKYSNGRVIVESGKVTLDGERVDGKLVNRLVTLLLEENSQALESLTAFMDKADENPDFRVVTRIYDFMAHNDLRTDAEGYVLAYKVVQHNYLDKYTGTMDNSPGTLVQMKRNKVNSDDEETCSHGLHVAARRYIPQYGTPSLGVNGDRVLLCKINPKDFVSIPTDYDSMKARVCEYLVLKDVTELFVKGNLDDEGQEV